MKRPTITTPCVADRYAGRDERIAEITLPDGRGLLLSVTSAGHISLYRADAPMTLNVRTPHGNEAFVVESLTVCLGAQYR